MMIIWRGFGIVVPIVLLISGWITSYWFVDTRIGNSTYLGWTMLWAGIVLILAALAALGGKVDENGEPIPKEEKSHHDFFWIPIWVWCIGFIGFGIYSIYKEVPAGYGDPVEEETSISNSTFKENAEATQVAEVTKRAVNFYNCAGDSINVEIIDSKDKGLFDFYVQSNDYEYAEVDPSAYTIEMDGSPYEIDVDPVTKRNEAYNEAWMILCGGVDFVVVEVTSICGENITEQTVKDVNWMDFVVDRYDGDDLIEPKIYSSNGGEINVVAPNVYIPQELEKNENVYVLIPINKDEELTEKFLDKELVYLSIR